MVGGRSATECDGNAGAQEKVGDLALVLTRYWGSCWNDSQHSNGNFLIQQSTVGDFVAYRVFPPTSTASRSVWSQTLIYFRFPSNDTYTVYQLRSGALITAAVVPAASVWPSEFTPTGVRIDNLNFAETYVFLPASTSVPSPAERVVRGDEATECDMSNVAGASLRDVAVVTMRDGLSNYCWTEGWFNYNDFRVEYGALSGSDGSSFAAYRFHPPATSPTDGGTASHSNIFFRAAEKRDYVVASYDGSGISTLATLSSVNATAGAYEDTGVQASSFKAQKIIVILPADTRFSVWPALSSALDGAWLDGNDQFSVAVRRFDVPGHTFTPGADWGEGPGTHSGNYGIPKKFFAVGRSDGREGVVWQDQTAHSVHMTWLASDLTSAETFEIYSGTEYLVSAASNGQNEIVLLLIGRSEPATNTTPNTVKAVKVSSANNGAVLVERTLDASQSALNVYKFSSPGASMVWDTQTGTIGVVLARTMTQGGDGLNHQGAIAFVMDPSTLDVVINHGQTSGHSFSNSLALTSDGNFLCMDLGDNYPRGVHLQRFNRQSSSKRGYVVYNFKTKHGTSATSPSGATYPEYTEISTGGQTYYKWSNDNYVYTELGHQGVVEVMDGLLVFFSGEQPPLDNSRVGAVLNEARNVGFVKVGKDLTQRTILSSGATETGGFYTFGGSWSTQTNEGVNFLTSFSSTDESASRLKTAYLGSKGILLYWEVWTRTNYVRTQLMLVDANGAQLLSPWSLSPPMRLAIQDDLFVLGDRAVAYAGASGKLLRYEVCGGGGCPKASGSTPASRGTGSPTPTPMTTAPAGTGAPVPTPPSAGTTPAPTPAGTPPPTPAPADPTSTPAATTAAPVRATVTMSLPAVQGSTTAELQAAVNTPAVKAELGSAIAAGLDISASRVSVTRVTVQQARRLEGATQRRLNSPTMSVDFEVQPASTDAASMSTAVAKLADSASQENTRFVSAVGSALSTAAATGGSSTLTALSAAVATSGVQVSSSGTVAASIPGTTTKRTVNAANRAAGPAACGLAALAWSLAHH
uniref:Uncharacterized protein n=1 Tax=Alexandrium monilatum TaxID=311494 RepID=A0A7S4Q871_9DINO